MDSLQQPSAPVEGMQPAATPDGQVQPQQQVQQPVQEPAQQVQEPLQPQGQPQQPVEPQPQEQPDHVLKPEEDKPVKFESTGNEVFDTLGSDLVEKGLDPMTYYQEAIAAMQQGSDPELSEESYQELVKVYGERVANIMERQFVSELKNHKQQQDTIASEVYNSFGGEESFKYIAEAILKDNVISAKDAEKLGEMLMQPGVSQKMAIKQIKELYMETSQYQQNPQLVDQGQPAQPVGLQPISRRDYTQQKMKAMAEKNYALVEQLNRRADLTMKQSPQSWK